MENLVRIEKLLDEVGKIKQRFPETLEEKFNIFSILSIGKLEAKVHTPFIAELLNPNGSHAQGDLFLQLFLEQLEIKEFIANNAIVKKEKSGDEGRMDLWIQERVSSNPKIIVIENKIDSGDQSNQLKRYYENAKKITSGENIKLLYLTLDGENPTEKSISPELFDKVGTAISYQTHIKEWLEKCLIEIEDAKDKVVLYEGIKQYLNLVKRLTNQTINNDVGKEIVDLIKENFENAYLINQNFEEAQQSIITKFLGDLKLVLSTKLKELDWEIENGLEKKGKNRIWFCKHSYQKLRVLGDFMLSEHSMSIPLWGSECSPRIQKRVKEYFQKIQLPSEVSLDGDWLYKIDLDISIKNFDFINKIRGLERKQVIEELSTVIIAYINEVDKHFIELHIQNII